MQLQRLLERVLPPDLPIAVEAYDGSRVGPAQPDATIVVRSPAVVQRLVATRHRELALARSYVLGELDVEGDLDAVLRLRNKVSLAPISAGLFGDVLAVADAAGMRSLSAVRSLPVPDEEVHLRGRRHSRRRDAAAIASHYDVSNDFYRWVLGPSMTYSCAVFAHDDTTLEDAQRAKHELISQKLALRPDARLLDIGCGWGGMVVHAARHHDVHAVGVTISQRQHELATKRIAEAGLAQRVQARLQDYREIDDGPYDAISSIGMFEHVGQRRLVEYFDKVASLLRPGGRFVNHAITRMPGTGPANKPNGFVNRYVFPDGELLELGQIVSAAQQAGLEVRHVESLREHYVTTLRHWLANLEANWEDVVREVGAVRARVWRLYMAGSALEFEHNTIQVQQVLTVKPDRGVSGFPRRPAY